jgi:NhaP-type Na+/H+ or K+/H+ antiporter
MMEYDALIIALIGLLGVGSQWVAWRTGWPAIALMLAAGVIAGPVLRLIHPEETFGELLEPMISIAVALILFEGGLSLNFRELRKTEGAVTRLAVIGIPVAWTLGAVACYYIAGLVWPVAILFAGILVVTGPTVVTPLLRQSNIAPRPRAILKWEGIVNDPFGALCAVLTYEYLRRAEQDPSLLGTIVAMLGAAVVAGLIGYIAARAIAWTFPRGHVPEYLKAPVLLVAVIGTFVASNAIQQETGLLAVTVMGMALANMRFQSLREIQLFKENITVLLLSGVFVLLSASLNLEVLRQFEWRFLAFIAVLLFIVRPAAVLTSMAFSRVPWNERLLIAWIAPRGIVAVAISGLFALRLDALGYGDGGILVTLSFAVVIVTILAHGFTIKPLARRLKVNSVSGKGLLIVGANEWSSALAKEVRKLDIPVTVADTRWHKLAPLRQAGVQTYHGEILSETTEDRLDLGQFQVLVATSDNEAYNTLVCQEFGRDFGRDKVYQLGEARDDDDDHRALPGALRGQAMFEAGLGVDDVFACHAAGWKFRKTKLTAQFDFEAARAKLPQGAELLFLLRADGQLHFFTHASRPSAETGDIVVSYAPPSAPEARGARAVKPEKPVTGESPL